jgi:hypothetical protein
VTEASARNKSEGNADFLEALYGDPLRTETTRAGRHLVIVSVLAISAVIFDAHFQFTNYIPLDFGKHIEALPTLLSVTVLLLALSFAMRATTDLFRDSEAAVLVTRYIEQERTKGAEDAARAVDAEQAASQEEDYNGAYDPDPWWEEVSNIRNASDEAVSKAEKRVGLRNKPRKLRALRKWSEAIVPLIFAVLALALTKSYLYDFMMEVFSALRRSLAIAQL